jgi:hypothetical protein
MILELFIIYLVISISTAFIWSFADIFIPFRNLIARIPYIRRPILCPECCSFWVGLLISLIFNPLFGILGYLSYVFLGISTHLFACFIYKIYFKIN